MARKRKKQVRPATGSPAGPAHNLSVSEILQREEDARDGWREEPPIDPSGPADTDRPGPASGKTR